MRVYDQREFEFEISIDNLVGILMYSDISKRDIVEECVLAWAGKDLVLLPVNSEEYRTSVEYTNKQSLKISTKDFVKGHLYEKKKSDGNLMYMGYHEYFDEVSYKGEHKFLGKKHVFYDMNLSKFVTPSVGVIAKTVLAEVHATFPKIDQKLHSGMHLQETRDIIIKQGKTAKNSTYYQYFKMVEGKILSLNFSEYANNKRHGFQCWISLGTISKVDKSFFVGFEYLVNKDVLTMKRLLTDLGINGNYGSAGYFNYFAIEDSVEYLSLEDLIKKMEDNGFGNKLVAVSVLGNENNWQ